jgi:hypothetical protein
MRSYEAAKVFCRGDRILFQTKTYLPSHILIVASTFLSMSGCVSRAFNKDQAPPSLAASVHENYVLSAIRDLKTQELKELKEEKNGDEEAIAKSYFGTLERLENLEMVRDQGFSWKGGLHEYLSKEWMPELDAFLKEKNITPSKDAWNKFRKKEAESLKSEADLLAKSAKDLNSPQGQKIKRILQLLSFVRSESIADGTIGDWNPASAEEIQASSVRGLVNVLNSIESKEFSSQKITLEKIQEFQGNLLGKAQHHFSQAGRINEIVFTNKDGKKTHVRELLTSLIEELNSDISSQSNDQKLLRALSLYGRFLHYHPFGDANGRTAEMLLQIALEQAQLLPLLTREKTAYENYAYQRMFGDNDPSLTGALSISKESTEVAKALLNFYKQKCEIQRLGISGANVVTFCKNKEDLYAHVWARVYVARKGKPLPPVKGAPVIADAKAEDLNLRYSSDIWKTSSDAKPALVIPLKRLGLSDVSFVGFELKIPSPQHGISFAYWFENVQVAGESKTVWFNNNQNNYNTPAMAALPID